MKDYKSLFLKQSYEDSWEEYKESLISDIYYWDYIVLTASNENQAETYRAQISLRLQEKKLPPKTKYHVISDPNGERVGSGGSTLNVIKKISELEEIDDFSKFRILIIHSGGDSKRVPQYSACGKIFSPVPRMLPDGRRSTIFDEFIISFSGLPARIPAGIFVASGDVLLLFNSLQIDFCTEGAAAISFKKDIETGSHHGVFLEDSDGNVGRFLHKKTAERLSELGAVDKSGNVNIDTGAIALDYHIVNDLLKIIKNPDGYNKFINSKVRLNFYSDFLIPMTSQSSLDEFLHENPENCFSDELTECRKILWSVLHKYRIKLQKLSPASFLHFGTTGEILRLLNENIGNYSFLGWQKNINTNNVDDSFSASNSYICDDAKIGVGSYIEDSFIGANCVVGKNCVISCLNINNAVIPDNTVVHGLKLKDDTFTVRTYGVDDNPKEKKLFGKPISETLWDYEIYPVCDTVEKAYKAVLSGEKSGKYTSLSESFNNADGLENLKWQRKILNRVIADNFVKGVKKRIGIDEMFSLFKDKLSDGIINYILESLDEFSYSDRIRIYWYMSRLCDEPKKSKFAKKNFDCVRKFVMSGMPKMKSAHLSGSAEDFYSCSLPVRVNWGGGWSDTPPYCNENGGIVLNAALKLDNQLPIRAYVRKLSEKKIVLACEDNGARENFTDIEDILDLSNPFDSFAIHKSALIVLGIVPSDGSKSLSELFDELGHGFSVTTSVVNIPRGSGLGTSSILAAACAKAISGFFNLSVSDNDIYSAVMCMEQLMSTGGGWQDQIGGLVNGIKLIKSGAGAWQKIKCDVLEISDETKAELDSRFCLIYSGQRRLARNLLRTVIGRYLESDPLSLDAFENIQRIADEMKSALLCGDVNAFAQLLSEHWEYSKQLDSGCTNTCIDQIFNVCEDMIDGKMICGAGGGGFLQVILKKGVTPKMLNDRLYDVFGDSGVSVWNSSFLW